LLTGGIGNTVNINYFHNFLTYKSKLCFKANHDIKISILHLDRFTERLNFLDKKLNDVVAQDSIADVEIQLHNTIVNGRIDITNYLNNKIEQIERQ
jgi:hypothetical protein